MDLIQGLSVLSRTRVTPKAPVTKRKHSSALASFGLIFKSPSSHCRTGSFGIFTFRLVTSCSFERFVLLLGLPTRTTPNATRGKNDRVVAAAVLFDERFDVRFFVAHRTAWGRAELDVRQSHRVFGISPRFNRPDFDLQHLRHFFDLQKSVLRHSCLL